MCWLSPPCLCGLEVPFGLILPLLVCWGHGSQDQPYIKMIWRIIKSICPRAHILGPQNRYFFNGLHMILMKMVPARLGMTVLGSTHPNPEIRPLLQTHWGVVLMQHVPDRPWFCGSRHTSVTFCFLKKLMSEPTEGFYFTTNFRL